MGYLAQTQTAEQASLAGVNNGAGTVAWASPQNCPLTTGNGAVLFLGSSQASMRLFAQLNSAQFAAIDNAAKINTIRWLFQIQKTSTQMGLVYGQLTNGATAADSQTSISIPVTTGVWEDRTYDATTPFLSATMSGAELRAGAFGWSMYATTGASSSAGLYLRASRFVIFYQNPDFVEQSLLFCEA